MIEKDDQPGWVILQEPDCRENLEQKSSRRARNGGAGKGRTGKKTRAKFTRKNQQTQGLANYSG